MGNNTRSARCGKSRGRVGTQGIDDQHLIAKIQRCQTPFQNAGTVQGQHQTGDGRTGRGVGSGFGANRHGNLAEQASR